MRSSLDKCCYECHKKGENYEACHDYCEKYKQARAEFDAEKARIKAEKDKIRSFDRHHFYAVLKNINKDRR